MGRQIKTTDWFRIVNGQPITPTFAISSASTASGNARFLPDQKLRISMVASVGKATYASMHIVNKFPIEIIGVDYYARNSVANGNIILRVGGVDLTTIAVAVVSTLTPATLIAHNKQRVAAGSTITLVMGSTGMSGICVVTYNPLVDDSKVKSTP
jgi:hypothetical protein